MPSYTYCCVNEKCTEFKKVIEVVHRMSEQKPHCICNKQYDSIITMAPLVSYKGKWFSNSGGY